MKKINKIDINKMSYEELVQFDKNNFNEKDLRELNIITKDIYNLKSFESYYNSPYENITNEIFNLVKNIKKNEVRYNISFNQEEEIIPAIIKLQRSKYYEVIKNYDLLDLVKDYIYSKDTNEINAIFKREIHNRFKEFNKNF